MYRLSSASTTPQGSNQGALLFKKNRTPLAVEGERGFFEKRDLRFRGYDLVRNSTRKAGTRGDDTFSLSG